MRKKYGKMCLEKMGWEFRELCFNFRKYLNSKSKIFLFGYTGICIVDNV